MHIYQASHTDGFRSLYLESVFSMPGKEYLIQFLPFQVNPSHHYYLFVKAFFKECLDTGLLCAFDCSPDVACSNARTHAVIKPCPHANAYSTASYCSFNTTEYFNSRFQLTPPFLALRLLGQSCRQRGHFCSGIRRDHSNAEGGVEPVGAFRPCRVDRD